MTAAQRPARTHVRRAAADIPRRLARRVRAAPAPLVLLLVTAALLGSAWALVTPPFQGPDESDHFAYAQHLAETGGAPSPTAYGGAGSHSTEETRALDALGLWATMGDPHARPAWSALDVRQWKDFERTLPARARADGDGLNPIAKNPPLYYAYASAAYLASPSRSLFGRLLATRLAGVLLFVISVGLVWLAAAELTPRVWVRTLAAGVVALEPQLAFMAGIVNADILLVAVWTAFVALAVRTLQRGPTRRRGLGLFALAAASALTHGRGIALLPPLAVVWGLACWRARPPLRTALRWSAEGLAVLAAALVALRLFTSGSGGGTLYGGQANYIHQGGFDLGQFLAFVWRFYFPGLPGMPARIGPDYGFRQMFVETFDGTFGSLDVRYSARAYGVLHLLTLLGLAGLVAALVVRRRELRERWPALLGLATVAVSLVALLHLVSYLSLLGSSDPLIVGRYALPLIALVGLAVAFVASSLPRRLGPLLAAALLAGGVALQLGGLALTVGRFYG